jgi:mono/diheme cytochrome c family protein
MTQVETQPGEGGRWSARGAFFSTAGQWRVEVIVRRRGFDDVRRAFDVAVAESSAVPQNPIPPTDESRAAGQAIYAEYCLACHGPTGLGDGPVGLTLSPRPSDLSVHVTQHPEGQLFLWITHGYPGNAAMPAFEDVLTEEERWHVVNYIETFAGDDPE